MESAHWVSTFKLVRHAAEIRTGASALATESARTDSRGHPTSAKETRAFGTALIEAFKPHGVPAFPNALGALTPGLRPALVPLLHMDPDAELAVVQISDGAGGPTLTSCRLAGRLVGEARACRPAGGAVFIASSALTHAVVRGRQNWPTPERMENGSQR